MSDSIFVAEDETERVEIKGGWVKLRKYISAADEREAQKAAVGAVRVTEKRQVRGQPKAEAQAERDFSISQYNIAMLSRLIVEWSAETPPTRDSVATLPLFTINKLIGALNEWNEDRTEDEVRDLEMTSPASISPPARNGQAGLDPVPAPVGPASSAT